MRWPGELGFEQHQHGPYCRTAHRHPGQLPPDTVERLLELGSGECHRPYPVGQALGRLVRGEGSRICRLSPDDGTEMVDYAPASAAWRTAMSPTISTGKAQHPGQSGEHRLLQTRQGRALQRLYHGRDPYHILACGAGGVSKLRDPHGDDIKRLFNFKYPYEYIGRFEGDPSAQGWNPGHFIRSHPI